MTAGTTPAFERTLHMKMTRNQWMGMALVVAMASVAFAEGGTVTGVIKYAKDAKQPPRKPLDLAADAV